jgi:uncharacterized membrane protein
MLINTLKSNYILITILVVGAILRFYKLDFQSLWLDEIHTINETNPSVGLSNLYDHILNSGDPHPPLYYYLLYFLFKILGYTTFVARSFSVFVGVLGIYAVYLLGKELYNKQVGLITAAFTCINYFHIYYSQEARTYVFFFLFGTLSFYRLVIFIKNPNRKNAIYLGLFDGLMLNFHFFGLFALFSKYTILLFFLILIDKSNRKTFFTNSFLSGVVAFFVFTPCLKAFMVVSNIKEFWIEKPDFYTFINIFNEFFGYSVPLSIATLFFIIIYFVRAFQTFRKLNDRSIIDNPILLSFFILITWIFFTLLIPIIRSYTSIPMIISRYFIILLPAFFMMAVIGIQSIYYRFIRNSFIFIFLFYSIFHLLFIKRYYNTAQKSQFRETALYIKQNNPSNSPIVSSLSWYLPFFLPKPEYNIIGSDLDEYLTKITSDTQKISSFWYFDAHTRNYSPDSTSIQIINKYFYIDKRYIGFDAWAAFFIPIKNADTSKDIQLLNDLVVEKEKNNITYSVENLTFQHNRLILNGWAFLEGKSMENITINIALIDNQKNHFVLKTHQYIRADVTAFFKKFYENVDNSGFQVDLSLDKLESGEYKIGIYLEDKIKQEKSFILTDKSINR